MSRYTGFTRIASSFDPMEIRLALAALEGADIIHIPPPMQLTHTLPMNSLAYGAMEIHVADAQADEAAALLQAIAAGTVIPHDQRDLVEDPQDVDAPPSKGVFAYIFGFFLSGVSSPLRGLLVNRKPKD